MKERTRRTWKKKKRRLLFKCPRCQCNALQGYKASHYSLAFVESSSGQIVTGLFLNRYWEKQAEQRTPNYPVLWGTIKLLIREQSQSLSLPLSHSLLLLPPPRMGVWACAYGQVLLSCTPLNNVKCCFLLLKSCECRENLCIAELSGTNNSFHVNKFIQCSLRAPNALLCYLEYLWYGLYRPLLAWHTCFDH